MLEKLMMNYLDNIEINPEISHGKPVIKGTRIMVSVILDALAEGLNEKDIIKHYPTIKKQDIKAAISYASELTKEEEILPLK